jgi:two-component system LytT family response regulator
MDILILEDEEPAVERLQKLVREVDPSATVTKVLGTINSALGYLATGKQPDLILSDIQLADGLSFEIFKNLQLSCPVIFTTAYNQYALDAFKANGIDYLLKPIKKEELENALNKYKKLFEKKFDVSTLTVDYETILQAINDKRKTYQKRIIVRFADIIKAVETDDVAYFFTHEKIDYLRTFSGLNYGIDFHLDELEEILTPEKFFRINRQFIINVKAIDKMFSVSKSRVKLTLTPSCEHETIVSTERSPEFKKWLTGK